MFLTFKQKQLSIAEPVVMGILNVTPDSFSDGGQFNRVESAVSHALAMVEQGAQIIDIGGESTRPGAQLVSEQEELDRVLPVIQALRVQSDCCISIDTSKPVLMSEAVQAGVDMINDVRALQEPGALKMVADLKVPVCLMHMQGTPKTMQEQPKYHHLVGDIVSFFEGRVLACQEAGIERNNIILDPGFGFGKTLEQNYQLLAQLRRFSELRLPMLVGMSRKNMIGQLLKLEAKDRLIGGVSCALIAAQHGANIIRVHDVKETVQALTILKAVKGQC